MVFNYTLGITSHVKIAVEHITLKYNAIFLLSPYTHVSLHKLIYRELDHRGRCKCAGNQVLITVADPGKE